MSKRRTSIEPIELPAPSPWTDDMLVNYTLAASDILPEFSRATLEKLALDGDRIAIEVLDQIDAKGGAK